jgi:hypothetical protein
MKTKLLLLAGLLMALAVRADLTAVVTPGYQFPTDGSVVPSYDLLNLLAQPTIAIYGTVGGSNTLAVGSVTGTQLSPSVADGNTIGFNANVPPGLQVLAAGITGPGLKAQSTTNLTLWVDTNYFQLATNTIANTNDTSTTAWLTVQPLALKDTNISATAAIAVSKLAVTSGRLLGGGFTAYTTNNYATTNVQELFVGDGLELRNKTVVVAVTNGGTVTTLSNTLPALSLAPTFTSDLLALPTSSGVVTSNTAHGLLLTNAPPFIRWVLVCQTNNCGYVPGDEVDVWGVHNGANGAPTFSGGGSSNTVWLVKRGAIDWMMTKVRAAQDGTFAELIWKARCYARP